jgi:hypothetical protein
MPQAARSIFVLTVCFVLCAPALAGARPPSRQQIEAVLSDLAPEQQRALAEAEAEAGDAEASVEAGPGRIAAARQMTRAAVLRQSAAREQRKAAQAELAAVRKSGEPREVETASARAEEAAVRLQSASLRLALAQKTQEHRVALYDYNRARWERADHDVDALRLSAYIEATGEPDLQPLVDRAVEKRDGLLGRETTSAARVGGLEVELAALEARLAAVDAQLTAPVAAEAEPPPVVEGPPLALEQAEGEPATEGSRRALEAEAERLSAELTASTEALILRTDELATSRRSLTEAQAALETAEEPTSAPGSSPPVAAACRMAPASSVVAPAQPGPGERTRPAAASSLSRRSRSIRRRAAGSGMLLTSCLRSTHGSCR